MNWDFIWKDIMAIVAVVINGIPQLILAASLGFALKPTAFAYFVGGFGNMITGSLTPISAQAETITVAGLIRNRKERATALIVAALLMMIMSAFGLIGKLADWAGVAVVSGMMAGVGLILADVSIGMLKDDIRTALVSIISAFVTWVISKDLVWTIFVSVLLASLDYSLLQKKDKKDAEAAKSKGLIQELKEGFTGLTFNLRVLLGALSFVCLNIGSNTAFGNITASFSGGTQNLDHLSFINSLADIPSAIFGGAPIEAIISGTGAAPDPVISGVIMMFILGILLITGLVEKIGKYVPVASIAGFLLIIGFLKTFIPNAEAIFAAGPEGVLTAAITGAGLTALGITALTKNPFIGMVCGIIITYTAPYLGL